VSKLAFEAKLEGGSVGNLLQAGFRRLRTKLPETEVRISLVFQRKRLDIGDQGL
jgi:hypothetical protein